MKVYKSVGNLIGRTPLLRLGAIEGALGLYGRVTAKLECFNPGGSAKDRVAKYIIDEAEASGRLKAEGVVIEPTSGNTGIGIASICAMRGYRAIIVMPENMSAERKKIISAYGAELVLTDAKEGMAGAIKKAEELHAELDGSVIAGQFTNPQNPRAHRHSTGPEIYEDMEGEIDYLVATVGTGGTISGVGEYLKRLNPEIKVIAVEPKESPVLSGGAPAPHKLQGIGAGFVPEILKKEYIDEIVTVDYEEAKASCKLMARSEGILVGSSSGAALYAAINLAKLPENRKKNIIVILPDTGERYLSTDLFD